MREPTDWRGTASSVVERLPIPDEIDGPRVVAIGRRLDPARLGDVAHALVAGGVRAFEVTLDGDGALDAVARLAADGPAALLLGAGTVLTVEAAAEAVAAGARFLVSPHLDIAIVAW